MTPPDSPNRHLYLYNMGDCLYTRYLLKGHSEDLEKAIRLHKEALDYLPPDSSDRHRYREKLDTCLRHRVVPPKLRNDVVNAREAMDFYQKNGALGALDAAVDTWEHIFRSPHFSTADPNYRPVALSDAGITYVDRYRATGRLEDLDRGLILLQQAAEQSLSRSRDLPMILSNLGKGLRNRYEHTGALADLERAIQIYEQAVDVAPPDYPHLFVILNNLGNALRDRYERTRDLADLERAIQKCEQAVKETPHGLPDSPRHLSNLGSCLRARYGHTGTLTDLERAIQIYEQAVKQTPPASSCLPGILNNLGNALRDRYERTRDLADLEWAIKKCEQAVKETPHGLPDSPRHLSNLGSCLRARYGHTGTLTDLERAIQIYEQAVKQTPACSPHMPGRLDQLGIGLKDRNAHTQESADLKRAISLWEQALSLLQNTFVAASVAYKVGQQREAVGFFGRLVSAYLERATVDPFEATAARCRSLEVAEASKSRVLTEMLGRGDLAAPSCISRDLIARESELLAELTRLDTAELTGRSHPSTPHEQTGRPGRLQRREKCLQQLDRLWKEMVQCGRKEAANYVALRRGDVPRWEDLIRLFAKFGSKTAFLSLFATGSEVLIFIVRLGWKEPEVILVQLTRHELYYDYITNYIDEILNRSSHRALDRPLTQRWRDLGQKLLSPLLPLLRAVDHLVISPHYYFHLLPLHALCINPQGETLLDYCSVSYTPALGPLLRLLGPQCTDAASGLVLGYTPAPSDTKAGQLERKFFLGEAKAVAERMGVSANLNEKATSAELKVHVDRTLHFAHLSCHGVFDVDDPMNSSVLLADGQFTARAWLGLRMQADLVTLSACQLGIATSLGGDEMAGFTQALLLAGGHAALLGLWSVAAPTTAAFMDSFYKRWGDKEAPCTKAKALQEASLELRNGQVLPLNGKFDPSDPYYWAPFALYGDWR